MAYTAPNPHMIQKGGEDFQRRHLYFSASRESIGNGIITPSHVLASIHYPTVNLFLKQINQKFLLIIPPTSPSV